MVAWIVTQQLSSEGIKHESLKKALIYASKVMETNLKNDMRVTIYANPQNHVLSVIIKG